MQIEADHSIHALAAAYRQSEARLLSCRFCQSLSIYSCNGKFKIYPQKLQNTNCFKLKKHFISYGREQLLPAITKYRVSVTLPKIDHFIRFKSSFC